MESRCRLCAEIKNPCDLTHKLDAIRCKLVECFGFFELRLYSVYPQNVCRTCVEQFERSWNFFEKMKCAQQQLRRLIDEQKAADPLKISEIRVKATEVDGVPSPSIHPAQISDAVEDEPDEDENGSGAGDDRDGEDCDRDNNDMAYINNALSVEDKGTDNVRSTAPSKRLANLNVGSKNSMSKKDFLDAITDDYRLVDGQVHPDKIAELNLVDWSVIKYDCYECSIRFDTHAELQTHYEQRHPGTDIITLFCSICPAKSRRSFAQKWALQQHVRSHHGHLHFCCINCNVYYWDKALLNKHTRDVEHSVDKLKPQTCPTCGKIYRHSASLQSHIITEHKPINRHYECYVCKRSMRSFPGLQKHMNIWHVLAYSQRADLAVCPICGKTTTCLDRHLQTHNPADMFTCSICHAKRKTEMSLKRHLLTHTNEKKYACNVCEYRTYTDRSLKEHLRKHSNERPYSCNYCPKRFKHASNVKLHTRIHTGSKPFKCPHCPYQSAVKANTAKHVKRRHPLEEQTE